jgi:hypothetical protein
MAHFFSRKSFYCGKFKCKTASAFLLFSQKETIHHNEKRKIETIKVDFLFWWIMINSTRDFFYPLGIFFEAFFID